MQASSVAIGLPSIFCNGQFITTDTCHAEDWKAVNLIHSDSKPVILTSNVESAITHLGVHSNSMDLTAFVATGTALSKETTKESHQLPPLTAYIRTAENTAA